MAPKKIHDTPSTRVMAYRKRRMEGMKRVEIWLADDELEQLDVVVEETGISRARVVALLLKERIEKNTSLVPVTLPLVDVCELDTPTESPLCIPASDQEESPTIIQDESPTIVEASITLSANVTECEPDKPSASTQAFIPTSDLNEPTEPPLPFPTSDKEASPRTIAVCEPNDLPIPILTSDKDASPTDKDASPAVTKTSNTIQPTPAPIAPPQTTQSQDLTQPTQSQDLPQPTQSQDLTPAPHQTVPQQPPLMPKITLPSISSSDPLKNRTQRGQMVFLASLHSLKNKTD